MVLKRLFTGRKRKPKEDIKRKTWPIKIKGDHALVEDIMDEKHPLAGTVRRKVHKHLNPIKTYSLGQGLAYIFSRDISPSRSPAASTRGNPTSRELSLPTQARRA